MEDEDLSYGRGGCGGAGGCEVEEDAGEEKDVAGDAEIEAVHGAMGVREPKLKQYRGAEAEDGEGGGFQVAEAEFGKAVGEDKGKGGHAEDDAAEAPGDVHAAGQVDDAGGGDLNAIGAGDPDGAVRDGDQPRHEESEQDEEGAEEYNFFAGGV